VATDLLVWIDLEMTGLDPDRERIIEAAVLVTDGALNVVEQGPNMVIHQSDALLEQMDEWNRNHHGASGLIDRVRQSEVTEAEAEAALLDFVRRHCPPGQAPLAGNSVHQDRRFLQRYMPDFERYLHYRIVDVSTIKELARRWYPDALANAPHKRESHRALDDIYESIAELQYYRTSVFR